MSDLNKGFLDNEKIIWSKEASTRFFSRLDILSIPLTLIVFGGISTVFSLYLYASFSKNPGLLMYFFVAGFAIYLVSFYFIIGRFFYRKSRAKKESYIITDKNIMIADSNEVIVSSPLDRAVPFVRGKEICFSSEDMFSMLFYNLGADALLKLRPKRALVFSDIYNTDEIIKIIEDAKKEFCCE